MSLRLTGVAYRYPSGEDWAVHPVDLEVQPGEIALLTGPTGCGKSTLLRLAAGIAGRHGQGERAGEVRVAGRLLEEAPPSVRVRLVGFVAQEPADQLVTGTLGDEVAFAMESAGLSAEAIERRIPELLRVVKLPFPPERGCGALSGGQAQRLAVAAALSAGAVALVLDEPLAWLDPAGALDLMDTLREVADAGVAILLVEHRLEVCLPRIDRVILMDRGRVLAETPAAQLRPCTPVFREARALGLSLPGLAELEDRLGRPPASCRFVDPPAADSPLGPPILAVHVRDFTWPGQAVPALHAVELKAAPGERIALLGPNGAGKSTLLALLSGALAGARVFCEGRRVAIPQDPDLALFCATVREELSFGPMELGIPLDGVVEIARALGVEALMDRPPQALSRGQRLRVAVAAALCCAPAVLALDEPTAGQDREQVERMMGALSGAMGAGVLVFATHDLDLALRYATRVLTLDAGRVVAEGPPAAAVARGLPLPSLARFCLERGLAPGTPAELAERAR